MADLLHDGVERKASEASEFIYSCPEPTLEALRLMALLEAAGRTAYEELANETDNDDVAYLLRQNAREELGHAHRVVRAIKFLWGREFDVPQIGENPMHESRRGTRLSSSLLRAFAASELRGEALYLAWARACGDQRAAQLFELNAAEERGHSSRLEEAAAMLGDAPPGEGEEAAPASVV